MKIKIEKNHPVKDSQRHQGIWKTSADSCGAHVLAYGLTKFNETPIDEEEIKFMVLNDIYRKLKILRSESVFQQKGGFNYDRFYDRFIVEAHLSLAQDYQFIDSLCWSDFKNQLEAVVFDDNLDYYENFFGGGEFPFIEIGMIERSLPGEYYVMYFLSR